MFEVKDWILRVWSQKKSKNEDYAILNCSKSGKKLEDGSYEKSMFISVIIPLEDGKCDWGHEDYTNKNIKVAGYFDHGNWKKDGKEGQNFTIHATKVEEYVFEKKEKEQKKTGW